MSAKGGITTEAFVWVLGSLCRQHRIPFDPSLLLQRCPPAISGRYGLGELLQAADSLGLRFGEGQMASQIGRASCRERV